MWWRLCLKVGTQKYRLEQLNKLAITAMQHLQIDAKAQLVATSDASGKRGLALHIDWHFPLPQVEQLALQIYVQRKIEEISGLDLHRGPFVVFVRDFATRMPGEVTNFTSHWLRERIARLGIRPKDAQDQADEVPAEAAPPAQTPSGWEGLEPLTVPAREGLDGAGSPVTGVAPRRPMLHAHVPPSRAFFPAGWTTAARADRNRADHRLTQAAADGTGLLEQIDVGQYMTDYGALRSLPEPCAASADDTLPMIFADEIDARGLLSPHHHSPHPA